MILRNRLFAVTAIVSGLPLLGACATGPVGDAMDTMPAPVANVSPVAPSGPALWRVADDDTTIYLFGTVHALPADTDWLDERIESALASSGSLVTEIHLTPAEEARAPATFLQQGQLPEGQSLRDMLSEEQRPAYEAALSRIGLPASAYDRFEPWLAAVNLSMIPLLKAGYDPASGVEKTLEQRAAGKQREALESLDYQVALFDGLPRETQINYLMEAATNIDRIVPQLDSMVAEWLAGDAEGLADLMNAGLKDEVLVELLLYRRNESWSAWIDDRLDRPGTVFIAVGAGHLAGERSVQSVLEQRGIASKRVE